MTTYNIKCGICTNILGFVENPADPVRAVNGYYCGSPSEPGSCAAKWEASLTIAEKLVCERENFLLKEKLKRALKELKASGEV